MSDNGEGPIPIRPTGEPVDVPREFRHPSSVDAGWVPLAHPQKLMHMPLGDVVETLAAVGYEIRLQVREKPTR